MSNKVDCVIKSGIVESVGDNYIKVKIHNQSACSMCYSKGVCTSLGSGERLINVEKTSDRIVLPGDNVDIEMISSSGWLAVIFGYVIPFILLISALLFVSNYAGEAVSAILSLAVLIPYYVMLYIMRHRMKKYFRFVLH